MSLRAGLDRGFDGRRLQRQRLGVGRFQRGAARPADQQTGGDGAQVGARFIERFAEIGADQALERIVRQVGRVRRIAQFALQYAPQPLVMGLINGLHLCTRGK